MRKLVYLVAGSVDGYIARADGSFDCFPGEGDHIPAYLEMLDSFGDVLMGRRTYEVALKLGASGVTSKPAIEGHFKTGQRTITLDELVLPYRLARWQVQFEYQHGILQDLIPVFPFLGRELRFQN